MSTNKKKTLDEERMSKIMRNTLTDK